MNLELDKSLESWKAAGLLSDDTATAIRAFEDSRQPPPGVRWPAALAMAFGGLMLAAGLLLFVSANWDSMSPQLRFILVVTLVAGLHVAGAVSRPYSAILAITLHAVGTAGLGAGVALCGQIFNLSGHWSNAIGLWALGAGLAYWLLREWPQFAFLAVLLPAFIAAELEDFILTPPYDLFRLLPVFGFVIALAYLALSPRFLAPADVRVLRWIGGLTLIPCALLQTGFYSGNWFDLNRLIFAAAALLIVSSLAGAVCWELIAAAVWVAAGHAISFNSIYPYLHWLVGGAGIAVWGVSLRHKPMLNLGIVIGAFGIVGFFLSNLFDKLDRSFGLIAAGILLIGVGFALDRLRRELIGRMDLP